MIKGEGKEERDQDQSDAFRLPIISIKALHDINPVRLLMCVGFLGESLIMSEMRGR